ncbi:hypothetical protein ASPZODRAFT_156707 [Penicilliopsis zonata CBS 506.65]|uniref:GPI anchored protein n=1 Tax=Penicilliopsis zonata CBS 506.65 TaxID=1073090 RepID=A0A1L9SR62_9EURO|nr:hypothetical protein ASPZODRAFT_156707 [Penicilliopsis zonata CBS 506.65]OJJ49613.1 hypothetical protein ASPZODRAFT_156707 [Penicilliopsis zonata CBS 506.65]
MIYRTYVDVDKILALQAALETKLALTPVQGVKKMHPDEGDKFFFEDWRFVSGEAEQDLYDSLLDRKVLNWTSRSYTPHLPFSGVDSSRHKRSFQCPTGTTSCESIDRAGYCCGTDDVCILVQETGSGDVGCCPEGETCSDIIGSCRTGLTACPESVGGGCCLPGYECVSGGCAFVSTVTVTVHSTSSTSTSTSTTSSKTTTTTSSTIPSTTSTNLIAPARPTESTASTSSITSTKATSTSTHKTTASVCPTGFYACSAVYQGGCCRTGRDCDTTSCPITSSSTIVSDGVTVVVPVTTSTNSGGGGSGSCASGWFSCADTVGGGCCPTGFVCGASCTATASTATGTVAKEQAGSAGNAVAPDGLYLMGAFLLIGAFLL